VLSNIKALPVGSKLALEVDRFRARPDIIGVIAVVWGGIHGVVTLVWRVYFRDRTVDRELLIVGSKSVSLGVGVGKHPSLEDWSLD
jgi:hypothetical protein